MTSLSSKFSSASNVTSPAPSPELPRGPRSPQTEKPNPLVPHTAPKDIKKPESPSSTPPSSPSPKPAHTFLQSALRRLSSSGPGGIGKTVTPGSTGVCPRRTMNVDPYRERCALPELDQNKLRRVSFCVDVEIAGSAQYVEDFPDEPNTATPIDAPSSLTKLGQDIESKKSKEHKLKRSEGEALKRPEAVAEEKEDTGTVKITGDDVINPDQAQDLKIQDYATSNGTVKEGSKEPTKKKEKKKRSESERKERKERKRREAVENGKMPAEIRNEIGTESSTSTDTPPKSQDRPTTDPLRIYRRCCQLRETSILKKIAEQISSPSACPVQTPGILNCLDLSGFWMQLPDVITLGDYLAVVPVKKLIMENCGLTDEAVRVLLAGLLAAKTPEQSKFNRKLVKKSKPPEKDVIEQLGVVEKISFKNNPKIGKDGWRHIATFIYMSRSLKAVDLSMIPIPETSLTIRPTSSNSSDTATIQMDMPAILQEAIGGRLAGDKLEEVVMAECGMSTDCIGQIVDAVIKCGATRLGLAGNNISKEGMEHIIRYLRSGVCLGLDIGGNDFSEYLDMFSEAIEPGSTLWALSLADCRLTPLSLEKLLPALAELPNFRFIDLSHNRELFGTKPSALGRLRKYLPRIHPLKRIHLMDVAMTSEHAIALADTLPECRSLAHLNLLENHLLVPLASAKTEAEQEEACALYASLMAAVRVSETLICIDIDVPSADSSEIVKALAKQVVAYSLRNLERLPLKEGSDSAIASMMKEPHGEENAQSVPNVLVQIVGHMEGYPENHDQDPPAPDDDYIVGGTGVVKALDICLKRAERSRKDSAEISPLASGTGTPNAALQDGQFSKRKAKEMSKNLLGSARKIRARLQPALVKESQSGDELNYRKFPIPLPSADPCSSLILSSSKGRLIFLDSTLRGMIQRFEDEFPETRLGPPPTDSNTDSMPLPIQNSTSANNIPILSPSAVEDEDDDDDDAISNHLILRPGNLSRRTSSPSLASRQAQEEGRIHRIGQRIKRDILRPETQDYAHGTTGLEGPEPENIQELRRKMESYGGEEIKEQIERLGPENLYRALKAEREGGILNEDLGKWAKVQQEQLGKRESGDFGTDVERKLGGSEEERGRKPDIIAS